MNKGSYVLVLELDKDRKIRVGKLGEFMFKKGYYIYVGSALNSLTDRVKRHLKKEKIKKWHIDYLLGYAEVILALLIPTNKKLECSLAKLMNGKILVKKFGSTDCNCESHLFFYKSLDELVIDLSKVIRCTLEKKLEI